MGVVEHPARQREWMMMIMLFVDPAAFASSVWEDIEVSLHSSQVYSKSLHTIITHIVAHCVASPTITL